jgi:hypothetical protein
MQIERDPLDVAFAVRSALFESLWPVHRCQRRKVMEEFSNLVYNNITWLAGSVIVVLRVWDDRFTICGVPPSTNPKGSLYEASYDNILSKTRPL